MIRLEDIAPGRFLTGLAGSESVCVTSVEWYGPDAMEVSFKTGAGKTITQILDRSYEGRLSSRKNRLPWTFDANAKQVRLASEAYRIGLAHLSDPYFAVHTSSLEPLPHQISAVYQDMLPRLPLRFILADDPGAGKTIMTGLLIKEMIARGSLKRCMIVVPGSLVEQWREELMQKFHLDFEILTRDRIDHAVTGNIFNEVDLCICRLDQLARNDAYRKKLQASEWDLIVCDEAHKMSATLWKRGEDIKKTRRYSLGELLSKITKNYLLLTATPHNGKQDDFLLFLSLIDPERFSGTHGAPPENVDISDIMRRLMKENLCRFDGTPLFPERYAYTVNFSLSDKERRLYNEVTKYVREEFNRADQLGNNRKKTTVGFALTVLQRRLASSPEAIYKSLCRRRERLEERLRDERRRRDGSAFKSVSTKYSYDDDEPPTGEQEEEESKVVDLASAASTVRELEAEINTLRRLEYLAKQVLLSGEDRKWEELSRLLGDQRMVGPNGQREKLIIFTEHRDTLNYLNRRIQSALSPGEEVVMIHGGMAWDKRREAERRFKQDPHANILVATDAAGEGINLQRAHLMINYDLPWNPNRLEQRFGRIHRIGQTETCHLWNLVAAETREGQVFNRLLEKLERQRQDLGGKVFDILGKMTFESKSLRDLLIEAVRDGEKPQVRQQLNKAIDDAINTEKLKKILEENALTHDVMDNSTVVNIRREMERSEASKLYPYYTKDFFLTAFRSGWIKGKIAKRETGRYEILSVPPILKNHAVDMGYANAIEDRYSRVCFSQEFCEAPGAQSATLIAPGHPLFEVTLDLIRERGEGILKQGTVFIDEGDLSNNARLLCYIEDSVQDGTGAILSKNLHFVEINKRGEATPAGNAPYLDYRPATQAEQEAALKWVSKQKWLSVDLEKKIKGYAVTNLSQKHRDEVKADREDRLKNVEEAVNKRMTEEINYWKGEASKQQMLSKRKPAKRAMDRVKDLTERKKLRLEELQKERYISSAAPVVTGASLVIPKGLLPFLMGQGVARTNNVDNRKAVEAAAVNAVMRIERSLGHRPTDVGAQKLGYDIESLLPKHERLPNGSSLRLIEVKGLSKGSTTVTLTKNEVRTAKNKEDDFILALIRVDENKRASHAVFLKHPFINDLDPAANSANYKISELIKNAEIVYPCN